MEDGRVRATHSVLHLLCIGEEKDGGGLRITLPVTLVLVGTEFFFFFCKNRFGHMHLCYLRKDGGNT